MSGAPGFSYESRYYRFSIISNISHIVDDDSFFTEEESAYRRNLGPSVPWINQIVDEFRRSGSLCLDDLDYAEPEYAHKFEYSPGKGWRLYGRSAEQTRILIDQQIEKGCFAPARITLCSRDCAASINDRFELEFILSSANGAISIDAIGVQLDRFADRVAELVLDRHSVETPGAFDVQDIEHDPFDQSADETGDIASAVHSISTRDDFVDQEEQFSVSGHHFSDEHEFHALRVYFYDRAIDARYEREILERRAIVAKEIQEQIRIAMKAFRKEHEHGHFLRPFARNASPPQNAKDQRNDDVLDKMTIPFNSPSCVPGKYLSVMVPGDADRDRIADAIRACIGSLPSLQR
ncbi:MAG: hypothetical protein OEZ10_13485 [Gammaproteobacteria bacterium]|nr:hypothetical protein [Gammaproteobacteria bacterium]